MWVFSSLYRQVTEEILCYFGFDLTFVYPGQVDVLAYQELLPFQFFAHVGLIYIETAETHTPHRLVTITNFAIYNFPHASIARPLGKSQEVQSVNCLSGTLPC